MQIVCVIKCKEFSQVTSATHLAHPFITAWILFYFCQDEGRGKRTYYTKSGANCLCDKIQWSFPSDISHSLRSSPFYSMDFILFMLNEGRGAIEHTTRNQVQINCLCDKMQWIFSSDITHSPRSSLYYSMDFILFMSRWGEGAIGHTTQNQVQIVRVIECNEVSQVTLATHFVHLLITAWILFYLC